MNHSFSHIALFYQQQYLNSLGHHLFSKVESYFDKWCLYSNISHTSNIRWAA